MNAIAEQFKPRTPKLPVRLGAIVVPAAIVAVFAIMSLVEPRFFSRPNLLNVARNFSLGSIVAIGQMLVLMIGGFDMSIGASAALAAIVAASVMVSLSAVANIQDFAVILGVFAAIGASAIVGILNGQIVARMRITPFMVTLATASMTMGLTLYFTDGVPVPGVPDEYVDSIGRNFILGIPMLCWISAVFILCTWWIMDVSAIGQHVRAVGGNERAAAAAGINVGRVKTLAYMASSISGGLLGVLLVARVGSGDPSFGSTAAIESIAAAVLGGTVLGGGIGKIGRVLPAVFLLAICSNALNLARVDSKWQACALGLILFAAVLLDKKRSA